MPTASEEMIWLKAARQGDPHAFSQIINAYSGKIASTIKGMLGNCAEAEDIGQEVFISFFRSIDRFRGDSSLSTFLTRIAINHSLNEIKRKKRWLNHNNLSSIEDLEKYPAPGESPETHQRKEMIRKAITSLPAKFRSVIVLRLIQEHSTEETAAILKLPLGTVQSRLARAQKKLKESLNPPSGRKS